MGPLAGPWRGRDDSNMALFSEFTSSEIFKFTFAVENDKTSGVMHSRKIEQVNLGWKVSGRASEKECPLDLSVSQRLEATG